MFNTTEFEAFRLSLPEDIQNEHFRWLITAYSVPRALYLIKENKLEQGTVDVKQWCEALGMSGERKQKVEGEFMQINLLTGVDDDAAMKDNINPDFPIIIVEHEFGKGKNKETSTLVIDGNKRLRKAFLTGREKMSAYFLPKELAKKIKL